MSIYIPDTFEEAKEIIPEIDEGRYSSWKFLKFVALHVKKVFEVVDSVLCVTQLFDYRINNTPYTGIELPKVDLNKVIVEIVRSCGDDSYEYVTRSILYLPLSNFKYNQYVRPIGESLCRTFAQVFENVLGESDLTVEDILRMLAELEDSNVSKLQVDDDYCIIMKKRDEIIRGWVLLPERTYLVVLERVRLQRKYMIIKVDTSYWFTASSWRVKIPPLPPIYEGHVHVFLMDGKEPLIIEENAPLIYVTFARVE